MTVSSPGTAALRSQLTTTKSGLAQSLLRVVGYVMSEFTKPLRGSAQKYRLQAFWEYLDGYAMSLDMYPDGARRSLYQRDVYAVVQDYWRVTDDVCASAKARTQWGDNSEVTASNGTQAKSVQGDTIDRRS